jgi:hypothetical protein
VLAGVATAGATLDNRNGATALPNDHLRLADILVPAARARSAPATSAIAGRWARGASGFIVRTSGSTATGGLIQAIDSTNLAPRLELSGVPFRIRVSTYIRGDAAGMDPYITYFDNGAYLTGSRKGHVIATANEERSVNNEFCYAPTAGTHIIAPAIGRTAPGTATAVVDADRNLVFTWEEVIRPNANNT